MKINLTHFYIKFFLISIIFLISGSSVFAITPGEIPSSGDLGIDPTLKDESMGGIQTIISTIVRWTYIIFFIVAVLFILFAAFTYLTAQGDPEKVKTATNQIIYAAIAIVVAFMAVGIDLIVKSILKDQGGGSGGVEYWPTPGGGFQWRPLGGDGTLPYTERRVGE